MAGNERSGRYSRKERTLTRKAEERRQDLARYLEGQDPDDVPLSRPRIVRTIDAHYQEGLSKSPSAAKCREDLIEHYYGKPITPVSMEVSAKTPEERAAAFMEALELLKSVNADKAMKESNGSESIN